MSKSDKFYFDNFCETTVIARQAADYLVTCLENYDTCVIGKMLEQMHIFEHSADKNKHEMNRALAKAFITPVDREDIDMLSNNLDDVIDKIEEILQKFYIYNIIEINTSAIEFAKKIVRACEILGELMCEFENYKKSKNIHNLIIKLNDVEEECDNLYLSSTRELSENNSDMLLIVSWREIFDCFEACADACEHVSECVGSVIMKNT